MNTRHDGDASASPVRGNGANNLDFIEVQQSSFRDNSADARLKENAAALRAHLVSSSGALGGSSNQQNNLNNDYGFNISINNNNNGLHSPLPPSSSKKSNFL